MFFSSVLGVIPSWLNSLVWTDYRLAILFLVIIPLVLLIWSFVEKGDSISRLLMIYWRVASLLAITVYLMIAAFPVSYVVSLIARILIPASLWFWVDLNEDIADRQPSPIKFCFNAWRWAITIYSGLGAVTQLFFLNCAFKSQVALLNDDYCNIWLAAPWGYREFFHANTRVSVLGFLGIISLLIYFIYLGYFMLIKLPKQGRSASG